MRDIFPCSLLFENVITIRCGVSIVRRSVCSRIDFGKNAVKMLVEVSNNNFTAHHAQKIKNQKSKQNSTSLLAFQLFCLKNCSMNHVQKYTPPALLSYPARNQGPINSYYWPPFGPTVLMGSLEFTLRLLHNSLAYNSKKLFYDTRSISFFLDLHCVKH